MDCYLHAGVPGVVTCGKCGVAMCKECEEKAFFRTENGNGQALCNRCSLAEAQEIVDIESSWLKKREVKLIICAVLIVVGLICLPIEGVGIGGTIICWLIAGIVANIGIKKDEGSVKSQVQDAAFDYEHPFLSLVIKIIGYTIGGPIMLIANFIGYMRTKSNYKKDLEILETIKKLISAN